MEAFLSKIWVCGHNAILLGFFTVGLSGLVFYLHFHSLYYWNRFSIQQVFPDRPFHEVYQESGRSSRGRLYFLVEGEGDALARLQYVQGFIWQRQYGWFALTSANRTQVMEVKFSRRDPYHVDANFEFFMPKGEDFYDLFDVDLLCAYTKEKWLEGRLPCDVDVSLVFDR